MKNRFSWQITILPVVFIILTAGILSFTNIFELKQEKTIQIEKATAEFIDKQKKSVKNRVLTASELIRFQSDRTEELVRKRVKGRVDEAIHIANAFYDKYHTTMARKELEEQIKLMLASAVFDHPDGYFFAVDMDTERIIVHTLDNLLGYPMSQHKDLRGTLVLKEQKKLLSHSDGSFQIIYFSKPTDPEKEYPKQLYIRYFKPFNWLIGTGEYLDDMEKRLQEDVLKRFRTFYAKDNEYLFIQKMYNLVGGDGKPYASLILSGNPIHQPEQPLFDTDQDSKGNYFRKEVLKVLRDNGEGFVTYWHPSPQHGREVKKTSFFFYDKTWEWAIGSGFYYDDLERQLAVIKKNINERIAKEIWSSIIITLLIIIIMSAIFLMISRRITRTIDNYAAKLEQAQKMEAIGTLAGGIAHDFNNILSSVIGFTELSLDEADKGSVLEDNLLEVQQAGKRAKDLVQQILTFSRQGDHEMKPLQVNLIVTEALKLLRPSLPTNIEIKSDIETSSMIFANPTQIHQIIMNLCSNAAYSMEAHGGILTISLSDISHEADNKSDFDILPPGDYVKLKIADTGSGIARQHLNTIFEPYFTTKPEGEGTGLGLSVIHGIVKALNGDISVESEIDKGTTFTVLLPIFNKPTALSYKETSESCLPGGNERILVVDDEVSIGKMTKRLLEASGYKVDTFTDSVEALTFVKEHSGSIDLVITDMTMPKMSGDKLAEALSRISCDLPVILCTGYSKKISKEKAEEIGIKAFAEKPMNQDSLLKIVREVLNDAKGKNHD